MQLYPEVKIYIHKNTDNSEQNYIVDIQQKLYTEKQIQICRYKYKDIYQPKYKSMEVFCSVESRS